MKGKIFVVVFSLLWLAGCDQMPNMVESRSVEPQKLKWAVVDERELSGLLNKIALAQNPYPDGSQYSDTDFKYEKRKLQSQITSIERNYREKCRINAASSDKSLSSSSVHMVRNPGSYDQDCLSKLPKDQLLQDLKFQLEKIGDEEQLRSRHREKLLILVRGELPKVVKAFSENEYALIIGSNSKILHSEDGVVVNITNAVVAHLEASPPQLLLEEKK